MEAKKKLLTYAGLKALEEELENLKVVKRKEVAAKIPPQGVRAPQPVVQHRGLYRGDGHRRYAPAQ